MAEPTSALLAFGPFKPQGFRSKPDRCGWLTQTQPTVKISPCPAPDEGGNFLLRRFSSQRASFSGLRGTVAARPLGRSSPRASVSGHIASLSPFHGLQCQWASCTGPLTTRRCPAPQASSQALKPQADQAPGLQFHSNGPGCVHATEWPEAGRFHGPNTRLWVTSAWRVLCRPSPRAFSIRSGKHLPNPHPCGEEVATARDSRNPAWGPSQRQKRTVSPRSHHGGARTSRMNQGSGFEKETLQKK